MKDQDNVKRPDHYVCSECKHRFNIPSHETIEKDGVKTIITTCPKCGSPKISISWWIKKKETNTT